MLIALAAGTFSLIISTKGFFISTGLTYMVSAPIMHYFSYEVRNPNEYYFYNNLGFSRSFLWIFTVGSAVIVGLIFSFI